MREHLLGYLWGALEPHECELFERRLASDPQLKRDLELLRSGLPPLEDRLEPGEAPAGLAERTCEYVAYRRAVLSMQETSASSSRWGFQDLLVAAGIFLAASMLFFPAVSRSRMHAQQAACQNNLRHIAQALSLYSDSYQGYLPYVPVSGNFASSAIYAPRLFQGGHLVEPRYLFCPGSAARRSDDLKVPTLETVAATRPEKLENLHSTMGGSYAITLGFVVDRRYYGARHKDRSYFPIVADVPCVRLNMKVSANHEECGQNVLFDSGRIAFLKDCRYERANGGDDMFRNADGEVGPGRHPDDAVIAPPWARPFLAAPLPAESKF